MIPNTLEPSSTPATSSPRTAGCPIRSASSPRSLAAIRMAARTRRKWATGMLERRLGAGMEGERALDEWEIDAVPVLGLDGDPRRVARPRDPERRRLAQDRIGGGHEPALEHVVGDRGRDAGLEPHRIEQAVVAKIDFADVHAVVQRGDEKQQREET